MEEVNSLERSYSVLIISFSLSRARALSFVILSSSVSGFHWIISQFNATHALHFRMLLHRLCMKIMATQTFPIEWGFKCSCDADQMQFVRPDY